MFLKSTVTQGSASPNASCPGIGCSHACETATLDLKETKQIACTENKASVEASVASPTSG